MDIMTYVLIAIVVLVILFAKIALVIIPQSETKIIERLGRYYATLNPGINIIIPFIDRAKDIVVLSRGRYAYSNSIDLREQVYDFPSQNVITKDNIQMEINALLYFQIVDPFKAVYEISNLPNAIEITATNNENKGSVTRHFTIIVTSSSGISEIAPYQNQVISEVYYNPSGVRIAAPQRGLNIIKQRKADGTTRSKKVFIP